MKIYAQGIRTVKVLHGGNPYGEISGRQKFHTAKLRHGENSVQRNSRKAKNLYGEKNYDEKSYGKTPTAKIPSAG